MFFPVNWGIPTFLLYIKTKFEKLKDSVIVKELVK
jgi:hypothetical protein